MASRTRLGATAARLSSKPAYICLQCRREASTSSRKPNLCPLPPYSTSRHASTTPITERMRKKIWGTDLPPGQENPYGDPGVIEQRRLQKEAQDKERGIEKAEPVATEVAPAAEKEVTEPADVEESDATTWEGMPTVGGPDWGIENWDDEHPFEGYMANTAPETREEMISIVHRALVEVMTLKQANLPLVIGRHPVEPMDDYIHLINKGVRYETAADGQIQILYENEELQQMILDHVLPRPPTIEVEAIGGEELLEDYEENGVEQAEEQRLGASALEGAHESEPPAEEAFIHDAAENSEEEPQSETIDTETRATMPVDDGWRSVPLSDADFKFAVFKRVMQLSGTRIPDPEIEGIKDSRALFTHLAKKPKPKKLAEILSEKVATDLPNVHVSARRYTPIDKEKEIGRWKIIERELEARGLPITGDGLPARGDPLV